ncbi:MAG: carboxypeptidase-like regulatory domain-containing protein [Cyclobacteriaceae bacterium]|nr:carboxypeptidase-like regulatory domain-containing protein [Cyclobacteriaceae bacterium]
MRITILTGFLLICSFASHGQMLTLSGKALDKETLEPLPYASVGLLGQPFGTVTNALGEFDFHIPPDLIDQTLIISMVGYQNYSADVSSLLKEDLNLIWMEKSNTLLSALVVSDSLNGGEILQIALQRMDQNYPTTPYLVEGFYRDIKKIADTYVSLLEAAIKIYDEDFREPRNKFKLRERVQLLAVRRSLGYSNRFTSYFDADNLLEEVLLHNNIRYRQFRDDGPFYDELVRSANSTIDGHDVFVISINSDFYLKLFIEQKTFGILRMEYENNAIQPMNKKRGLMSKFVGLKKTIDYKYYQGKLYLNYVEVLSKINWYDLKTDSLKFETELAQRLMINRVFPDSHERIPITSKMRRYGLQYQDLPYNKEFWDNYNVIKGSPLDAKIIADLEREGPLEKQFEKF